MKKTIKLISILLIALFMTSMAIPVFATEEFTPINVQANVSNTENIQGIGNRIVGIIRVVGTIVAVAILIVLGIKYMMGSAEEKAEYKKTLFPYIIGAILIFAAANLAQLIYTWASSL